MKHLAYIGQQLHVAIITGNVVDSSIVHLLAETSLDWNFISQLSLQGFIQCLGDNFPESTQSLEFSFPNIPHWET